MITKTPAIVEAEDRRDVARKAMLNAIEQSLAEVFGDRQATRLDSREEFAAVKPGTVVAIYDPNGRRADWATGPRTIDATDGMKYRSNFSIEVIVRTTKGGTISTRMVDKYRLGDARVFEIEAIEGGTPFRYRPTNSRDVYDLGLTLDEFRARIAKASNRAEVERLGVEHAEAQAALDALSSAARKAEEDERAPFIADAEAINAALNGEQIATAPAYGAPRVEIAAGRASAHLLRVAMLGYAALGIVGNAAVTEAGLAALARRTTKLA